MPCLRHVEVYHEYGGPYAVTAERAAAIGQRAYAVLGAVMRNYVTLGEPRGVRIPTNQSPINYRTIRIPQGNHALLFTGRRLVNKNNVPVHGVSRDLAEPGASPLSSSLVIVSTADGANVATENTIHEGAHSLGLQKHCDKNACVMSREQASEFIGRFIGAEMFCVDCQGDLEVQGHMAQAKLLS